MKFLLAIDQGTTSTRAILFDETGGPLASHAMPLSQIYPECPQAPIAYAAAKSINLAPGLQIASLAETGNPTTILGYAGSSPAQNQQCTWVKRVPTHPAFQGYKPVEVQAKPGELTCS